MEIKLTEEKIDELAKLYVYTCKKIDTYFEDDLTWLEMQGRLKGIRTTMSLLGTWEVIEDRIKEINAEDDLQDRNEKWRQRKSPIPQWRKADKKKISV